MLHIAAHRHQVHGEVHLVPLLRLASLPVRSIHTGRAISREQPKPSTCPATNSDYVSASGGAQDPKRGGGVHRAPPDWQRPVDGRADGSVPPPRPLASNRLRPWPIPRGTLAPAPRLRHGHSRPPAPPSQPDGQRLHLCRVCPVSLLLEPPPFSKSNSPRAILQRPWISWNYIRTSMMRSLSCT